MNKSTKILGLEINEVRVPSSDSTNGSRETAHIFSARFIRFSHSAAARCPNDFSIAAAVPALEEDGKVSLAPSGKK